MKDCKQCYHYKKSNVLCNKFKMTVTDSNVFAMCCKEYSKKVKKIVQCKDCINMNKYSWCSMKRICMNDKEKYRDRQCRYHFKRKNRKNKKEPNGKGKLALS